MSENPKVDNSVAGDIAIAAIQSAAETIQAAESAAQPAAEPIAEPAASTVIFPLNGRDFMVAAEHVRALVLLHGTEVKVGIENAIHFEEKKFHVAEQPLIAMIQRFGVLLPKAADADSGEDTL